MTFEETMAELKRLGTAQNVKVYSRHAGGEGNIFGVSFADFGKLKKTIKTDHDLAQQLWESGNFDARILAAMIADPAKLTAALADSWVKDVNNYVIGDQLGALVAKSPAAGAKVVQWRKSKKEFVRQVGYVALGASLVHGGETNDEELSEILRTIEAEIHGSPNRARHSMYMTLIAIGIYRPNLTKQAKETAKRIGKIEVDHGDTSCKTPDAIAYIDKALKRGKTKSKR